MWIIRKRTKLCGTLTLGVRGDEEKPLSRNQEGATRDIGENPGDAGVLKMKRKKYI